MSIRNLVRRSGHSSSLSFRKRSGKSLVDADFGEEDIWFEKTSHEGTLEFRKHVRLALDDFQGRDFSMIIFKSIFRELKGRRFFWGEGEKPLEIQSDDVLYTHFEEAYQEERERCMSGGEEKDKSIDVTLNESREDEDYRNSSLLEASDEGVEEPKKKSKKYYRCICKVDVDAPLEEVKEAVFDLIDCEKWNPEVESVEEASNGDLNSRKCNFYSGGFVDEQVVEETDSMIQFQVTTNRPSKFKALGTEFRIQQLDDYTTQVTSIVLYRPKFTPFAMCASTGKMTEDMGASAWRNAQGIKHYCQTGEVATDEMEFSSPPIFDIDYY
eukprot:scaffold2999_cov113-Cylindrotheca_fusiformis.AAC.7